MTPPLGEEARELLARLLEAEAAARETYFVIVRLKRPRSGLARERLPRDGERARPRRVGGNWRSLTKSVDKDGRLKTFYLDARARETLDRAAAEAGAPGPLQSASAQIQAVNARRATAELGRRDAARLIGWLAAGDPEWSKAARGWRRRRPRPAAIALSKVVTERTHRRAGDACDNHGPAALAGVVRSRNLGARFRSIRARRPVPPRRRQCIQQRRPMVVRAG